MKAGFIIPNNQGVEDPNDLVALAVYAEELGYNSVWTCEHLFHSSYVAERLGNKPYHDPLTVLAAAAQATERVRLATSVLVLPWHDPARLGKMVATLDQLSGGRVTLGVGVAVTRDEFENLGVDFATRGKRADEVLGALKALWTQEVPEFSGEFYNYSGLKFSPKPQQRPHPPLLIGGTSPAAQRRVARFGDGWHALRQTPKQYAAGRAKIVELVEAAGRNPADLTFSFTLAMDFDGVTPAQAPDDRDTLSGTDDDVVETVKAYEAAGVDEIVVSVSSADIALNRAAMSHFMEAIWPRI